VFTGSRPIAADPALIAAGLLLQPKTSGTLSIQDIAQIIGLWGSRTRRMS